MSRRHSAEKRIVLPDAKYGNKVVAKFINNVMEDGKKAGILGGEIDVTVFSNVYADGPFHYDAKTNKYTNTMGTKK